MKNKLILSLLFLFILINKQQAQKFGLAIVTGANLSQIDGDNQQGYKKVGIVAGLRSIINLKEELQIHTEILYSQHGAAAADYRNITIDLNYVEIPFYLSYQMKEYENGGFSRVYLGLSFAKLLSFKTSERFPALSASETEEYLPLETVSTYFNKTDIGMFVGFHVLPFNESLGIDLRFTYSANLLFNVEDVGRPIKNRSLKSFFISFRLFYEINHIGDRKKKKRKKRRRKKR